MLTSRILLSAVFRCCYNGYHDCVYILTIVLALFEGRLESMKKKRKNERELEFDSMIGKRLREQRERNGYTREKFSTLSSIDDKFLYEIETGRKGLSAYKLFCACKVLGITMDSMSGDVFVGQQTYDKIISLLDLFTPTELRSIEGIIRNLLEFKENDSIDDV